MIKQAGRILNNLELLITGQKENAHKILIFTLEGSPHNQQKSITLKSHPQPILKPQQQKFGVI